MSPVFRSFSLTVTAAREGDRVTALELFFDLVFVFAFTQVTGLMTGEPPPSSLVDGFIVLSLLWWSWAAFAWLANQAHADEGVLRGAFIVAMVAVFLACLAIPDAFHDAGAGVNRAGVLVGCYAVVRFTHAGTYLLAARGDARLRRQVLLTVLASIVPTVALLAVGVAAGEPAQRWIWLAAVLYDFAAVFVTAVTNRGWRIQSAAHFAERHSLVVILALGESVVDIAAGLNGRPLDWPVAVGAVLSILVAVGLWHAYFGRLFGRLEESLRETHGRARSKLGQDIFTYFHFPIIAGVIVTATGIKLAMAHLDEHRLGTFGGWALAAGVSLFLLGTVATAVRSHAERMVARIVASALLLAVAPLLAVADPLVGVGAVAVVVLALAVVEQRAATR